MRPSCVGRRIAVEAWTGSDLPVTVQGPALQAEVAVHPLAVVEEVEEELPSVVSGVASDRWVLFALAARRSRQVAVRDWGDSSEAT